LVGNYGFSTPEDFFRAVDIVLAVLPMRRRPIKRRRRLSVVCAGCSLEFIPHAHGGGKPERCDPCRDARRRELTKASAERRRNPCQVCQKPCHGLVCQPCRKERKLLGYFCACGNSRAYGAKVCRTCFLLSVVAQPEMKRQRRRKGSVNRWRKLKAVGGNLEAGRWRRIGARDGWSCWLCGGTVDQNASLNGRMGPTADHVVPLACGGSDDDSNLRLAHRSCNSRRRDRASIVALVSKGVE
jgi:hypothetical protein